ncbi:MAG: tetratricopeptide repeat protein [Candidatus Zixiibacteriota bacterium]
MSEKTFAPDGYIIERLLGTGGTARVYLARNLHDNHHCALKTTLTSDPDNLEQFRRLARRELHLVGGLKYHGLVKVSDFRDDAEYPFLKLDYCPGATLDSIRMIESIEGLLNLLSSIAVNLHFLNIAGLYHGDLKPHNIFLTREQQDYSDDRLIYSKISDFSLALKAGESNTERLGLGTVGYMAPETIDSGLMNHRSDIFAFGVIAYKLATGKHPFMENETDPVRINGAIKEALPPSPESIVNTIPKKLSGLIMAMLEKEPDKRPTDSFDICKRLEIIGSRYPYKKAIRPKHVMELFSDSPVPILRNNEIFKVNEVTIHRMDELAGEDPIRLRKILEIYFIRGLLKWEDGKMIMPGESGKLFLPRRLFRLDRAQFHKLPYSKRKRIILSAISGGRDAARAIGIIDSEKEYNYITSPLLRYAAESISAKTMQRFADKIADRAITVYNNTRIASRLYLKAGNLEKGYTTTLDASNELINANKYDPAFDILRQLAELCRHHNELKKLRIVLMQIADTEKMIGETVKAEKSYHEIIDLYHDDAPDKLLAETYKDLGDLYRMKQNYEKGLKALHQAERLYTQLDDRLQLSHTLNNIGNLLAIKSQYNDALASYHKALKIQHQLQAAAAVASTLNNIGGMNYFKGRYSRALQVFKLALKIQRETGNAGEIARTLNNLGCTYQEMAIFDEAQKCLDESLQLNRTIGSKREILYNLDSLTSVMFSAGNLKDSIKLIREGIALSNELSDKPLAAYFTTHLARVQKRMGFYGQAYDNFRKALEIFSGINDTYQESGCHAELADLYHCLNMPAKAGESLQTLLNLANNAGDKRAHIIHQIMLGAIKKNTGAIEKALGLAEEIKATTNIKIARLKLTGLLVAEKRSEQAGKLLEELSAVFSEDHPALEIAEFYGIYGDYYAGSGNYDRALEYYEKALRLSSAHSLKPEMIDAHSKIAAVLISRKEYESGYKNYRQAINLVKAIAEDIKDENLRTRYLSGEKIASMAGEVKKLGQILAQTKRAG